MNDAASPSPPGPAKPVGGHVSGRSGGGGWLRTVLIIVVIGAGGTVAWWGLGPNGPRGGFLGWGDDDGGGHRSNGGEHGGDGRVDGQDNEAASMDNAPADADNRPAYGDPIELQFPPTADPDDISLHDPGDGSQQPTPQTRPRIGDELPLDPGADTGPAVEDLQPWPADHPLVARLLALLRYRDFAAISALLSGMRADPIRAWLLVAGALVATDSMYARAVLVGILAGDFPELAFINEVPILERATGILFAKLLLLNPEWVRPEGSGYQLFQKRMLITMFGHASPKPPVGIGSIDAFPDGQRLTDLLQMVRETDAPDVQNALLDFVGRTVATLDENSRPSIVLTALTDQLPSAANKPELLAGLLAAIWMTDGPTGVESLTDALVNGAADGRRTAAIEAMQRAWQQAQVAPAGELWNQLLDAGVPPTGGGISTTGEARQIALELIGELAGDDRLSKEAREDLIARLDRAVFTGGDEAPVDADASELRAGQLRLLAQLEPEDGDLVARLDRVTTRDADPVVRQAALEALGGMPLSSARDVLRRAARDDDATVGERTTALGALVAWSLSPETTDDHHESTRVLLAQLSLDRVDTPTTVRAAAARLLGTHWASDGDTRAQLRAIGEDDPDAAVRAAAITGTAEGAPSDRRVRQDISDWLKSRAKLDPSPAVRSAADRGRSLLAE